MSRFSIQLVCLVAICIGVKDIGTEWFNRKFDDVDIFRAGSISGDSLRSGALIDKYGDRFVNRNSEEVSYEPIYSKLNELLVSRTNSEDPNENLDIILDELLSDYKRKELYKEDLEGKRLLLSLRTLTGKYECGYFSRNILLENFRAAEMEVGRIIRDEGLNRIEKILAHYIKRHVINCRDVYFANFDQLYKELDPNHMKYLDAFMRKAIDTFTLEESPENQGKSYAERLLFAASDQATGSLDLKPAYVYNALKEIVKGDPDEQFVVPVENSSGMKRIRFDIFNRLYDDYVVKPCFTLRHKLGPEVFQPFLFDSLFGHRVQNDRVDFYEVLLKYKLCYFKGSIRESVSDVIKYANNS